MHQKNGLELKKEYWSEARKEAFQQIDNKSKLHILGCDTDKRSILRARDNAANLGLDEDIAFFIKDMRDVDLHDEYGVVITNPPMEKEWEKKKKSMNYIGILVRNLDSWKLGQYM